MEDNAELIKSLLEKATEYVKTSYDLVKLKTIDKASDIASSFISRSIVFVFFASFLLFLNLGLAFWLGNILGEICYGFFVVAAFYAFIVIVLNLFMRKWFKKIICNYIIKQILK